MNTGKLLIIFVPGWEGGLMVLYLCRWCAKKLLFGSLGLVDFPGLVDCIHHLTDRQGTLFFGLFGQ